MKAIYVPVGKLDQNQRAVYNLRLDASFIVQGCAGSGKTSLAMLRMQQKLEEDKTSNVTTFYYIAFVRELVECIRRDIRNCPQLHAIAQRDDFLITYENWTRGEISDWMRKKFGITPRDGMRRVSQNGIYTNIDIAINKNPDYLFVDECQDLQMEDIGNLVRSARVGVAFYGDDAQHIMNWTGRTPVLLEDIQRAYPDKFHEIHQLLRNYRLPKEIAAFAQEIGGNGNLAAHCKSPYHEKPVLKCVQSSEKSIEYMVERIRNLDLQDVAVVVPTNEDSKAASESISRQLGAYVVSASWEIGHRPESGVDAAVYSNLGFISPFVNSAQPKRVEGVHYSYLRDTRVKIMTYEKVKGQQFETVFLLVYDEMDAEQIKRFYVGITRAERFLYVLYTNQMPACLRQVPVELYNTTDETLNFDGLYRPGADNAEGNSAETAATAEEGDDW